MIGSMPRHGPHQLAQKSTSTGSLDCSTSRFQLKSCSNITTPLSRIALSILRSPGRPITMTPTRGSIVDAPKSTGLPRNVKVVGLASLLNDIASEMIYPVLPYFLLGVLGAG